MEMDAGSGDMQEQTCNDDQPKMKTEAGVQARTIRGCRGKRRIVYPDEENLMVTNKPKSVVPSVPMQAEEQAESIEDEVNMGKREKKPRGSRARKTTMIAKKAGKAKKTVTPKKPLKAKQQKTRSLKAKPQVVDVKPLPNPPKLPPPKEPTIAAPQKLLPRQTPAKNKAPTAPSPESLSPDSSPAAPVTRRGNLKQTAVKNTPVAVVSAVKQVHHLVSLL